VQSIWFKIVAHDFIQGLMIASKHKVFLLLYGYILIDP